MPTLPSPTQVTIPSATVAISSLDEVHAIVAPSVPSVTTASSSTVSPTTLFEESPETAIPPLYSAFASAALTAVS